ncbi:hypothetical protein SAY86_031537 [Trapa natans]|uniref:tRNA(adenine(34)) deaminase n=1 Tax=Trapa natans TaxID=22666 RepID=A0AAN7LT08_TRANT|nr:hypothetical protein SAY86_031537 [Trapa natans]
MYSSTVLSLRSRGFPSFPFTDHSHSSSADRFDRCGLHFLSSPSASCHCSCCCCCCCHCACCGYTSASVNRLSVTPNTFLYGTRQSSLLQWSASRRLIFSGGDRDGYRVPGYGVGRDTYESSRVNKKMSGEEGSKGGRRRKVVKCMVSEGNGNIRQLSRFDDAEALLSLLSEEVCEESFGGREERNSSFNRVEIESKRIYGSEFSKGRKKNLRSDLRERDSKHKLESVEIESKEECQSCKGKGENGSRQENAKVRKAESSCSSYYSISSSGDLENDPEEVKDENFEGNLLRASNEDSLVKEQSRIQKDRLEEWKRTQRVKEEEVKQQKESTSRSNAEWDWRKKSEKKLVGVSIQETQSTEEFSLVHSKIMKSKVQDSEKVSSSRCKLIGVDEKLDVSANLDARGSSYGHMENQAVNLSESRNKTEKSSDVCRVCGSDLALSSKSEGLLNMTDENMASSVDFVGEIRDDSDISMKRYTGQTSAGVKIQEIDSETASKLQESDTAEVSHRKESKSFTSTSEQEREQQKKLQMDEKIIRQNDKGKSQEFSEFLKSHQNVERPYASHRKYQEENTNLVSSSVSNSREQNYQVSHEEAYHSKHSREETKDVADNSSYQANVIETASSSQRASEGNIADRRSNITVVVNVGDAVSKSRGESSLTVTKTGSRVEPRRLNKVQSSPAWVPRLGDQAKDQAAKDKGSSKVMLTPPVPQVAVKGPVYREQVGRMDARESKGSGERAPELKTNVESGDVREDRLETPVNQLVHEDALDSAQRSDQLSYQVVGEFIEKAHKEFLNSEIQSEASETVLANQTQISSIQFDYGVQVKGGRSQNSSDDSEIKGPSDEIWLETTAFSEEPLNAEAELTEGSLGSGQAIVKRSGRSLWSIIADIVRLPWRSHVETPHSAFELKKKSSSGESVSSEAWFSGREQGSTPLEAITPLQRNQSSSVSTRSHLSDKNRLIEEHISSSLNFGSSSASNITSSAYLQKYVGSREDIKQLESDKTPLPLELVEPLSSSTGVEATDGADEVNLPFDGLMEGFQPHDAKLVTVSGLEAKGVQFKQRKLQINRQVPKDRFDEWEEANNLESEQRKIDEMFMREALVEAKKAADNWEVPAGAVLVQHGKIVARGCNLVEELRDATAHAELICIREASKVLRSWRLADSTLYVTLEPCAMCAGAILQARIDTLVWGAPNKLLGADGSWIRIFPIGEGSSSWATAENLAPPVHPFHPNMTIRRGVLASECADTMQQFFQLRRKKKEKKPDEPTTPPPSCLPVASHPSKLLNKMQDIFHLTFCL